MKIYDITRELFSAQVYPGDPVPYSEVIRRMDAGDSYNLTAFYSGCHSGTHIDAPNHFVMNSETIDQLEVNRFIGKCTVVSVKGILTGADMDELLPKCEKMLLLKGNGEAFLSQSAAFAIADADISLVGTDAQSIAEPGNEKAAHYELLSRNIPILEGADFSGVEDGTYTLIALPLKLKGLEASPARVILIED